MTRSSQDDRLIDMREHAEPDERTNPVPWLLWIVAFSLVVWGASYFLLANAPHSAGGGTTAAPSAAVAGPDGAQVFSSRCVACHQATGQGLPGVFPPLAGSEWVNGSAQRLAGILLLGIQGNLTVKGAAFNGTMPTFGTTLSDAEIAAVGTYVRSHFGNQSAALDVATVKAERDKLGVRATPWGGESELRAQQ